MSKTARPPVTVTPIDESQQQQVVVATHGYIHQAGLIFDRSFKPVPIHFDLIGATAGMYKIMHSSPVIRYNPYIFSRHYQESLNDTVPHEVAHYITDQVYGLRRIRPHGQEWRALMERFGVDACVTGHYDLTGIPRRIHERFTYRCDCSEHQLTSHRHNKIVRQRMRYKCLKCGSLLKRVEG